VAVVKPVGHIKFPPLMGSFGSDKVEMRRSGGLGVGLGGGGLGGR
jgi:hypothetical protein